MYYVNVMGYRCQEIQGEFHLFEYVVTFRGKKSIEFVLYEEYYYSE